MSKKQIKFFLIFAILYLPAANAQISLVPAVKKEDVKADVEKAKDKVEQTIEDAEQKTEEKVSDSAEDKKEDVLVGPAPSEEKVSEEAAEEKNTEEVSAEGKKISVSSIVNANGEIKVEGVVLSKNLLAEIYSPRDYKTIWFDGKIPNANYQKAVDFISLADENGLSRRYFDVDVIKKRVEDENQNEQFVARTDALITFMVAEMLQQVGNGQVISKDIKLETYFTRPVRVTNPAAAFEEFLTSNDTNAVIEKYSPKHPQYLALRKALRGYIEREGEKRGLTPISYSRDLVPGDRDHTISEIRKRMGLRISADPKFDPDTFDKGMTPKISEFQHKFKQKETGIIDKEFIDALNNHDIDAISIIKTNMERYRWLKDDLEPTRLVVNLASFQLDVFDDNKEAFSMGVIAGREGHNTPIMSTRMYQFVLNPYWNVPKGYFVRNMLPMLRQDPNYVKNQNFDLMRLEKDGWKVIDQSSVNWDSINEGNNNFLLRQRPGNINVLGPIKFAIINPYDIFMHSTSEPWLFTNKFRGYSSGCIRVEDPIKLSKFVIEKGGVDIKEEEFMSLYKAYESKDGVPLAHKKGVSDRYFKFKTPVPTYTTYFTAHAKEDGTVEFYDDVYNLDFAQSKSLGI